MTTTDKKAEPFRITGEGTYRMRNGGTADIIRSTEEYQCEWTSKQNPQFIGWSEVGKTGSAVGATMDIVERVDKPAEEMAGLSGYMVVAEDGVVWHTAVEANAKANAAGLDRPIIDLSKVPASAIVRPKPKVETGWVNIRRDGDGPLVMGESVYMAKCDADRYASHFLSDRIACIEITFTIGEGVEAGK